MLVTTLSAREVSQRTDAHVARVAELLGQHPQTTPAGEPHPVWQFLFRYYSHKPSQLRRWHPGHGIAIATPAAHTHYPHYEPSNGGVAVTVSRAHLATRARTVAFVADLLHSTSRRPARLNCFGAHEWAMVYRAPAETLRHRAPLRLSPTDTDAAVESIGLRCTHFDAFRFFTADAVPRNAAVLTRDTQPASEQPGCLHAGMDLYKWAHKLSPLICSDLVVDALTVAFDLRELDMRASPYDFEDLGLSPITIETAAGRAEYVRLQVETTRRAAAVRADLMQACESLLRTIRAENLP
ncbi:3-methyladenine DNA glycosylase [Williamsia sp. CHRR-6]|uniref:3-methyladenine DNA glycosylase n=1 Tax=Williamsia sp. CHRR-6 TaxID=2835871 RepID=UPI001BDA7A5F|nr:3-methyladenine DNA glycosylase [Williamsia sp. CHRR-6]MBT0568211.1 3-methyladenine DNA glycosylase [Williamsia sp. CHRR-6]